VYDSIIYFSLYSTKWGCLTWNLWLIIARNTAKLTHKRQEIFEVFFSRWKDILIKRRTETIPIPPYRNFCQTVFFIIFQYATITYTSMCFIWLQCRNTLNFVPNRKGRDVMRGKRVTAVTCRIASMSSRCTSVTYVEL